MATLLASTATKENMVKVVNKFYYSESYTVNFDTGEISNSKGVPVKSTIVRQKKGRYRFEVV